VIVAQEDQLFVELPDSLMAVAPGTLTSQVVSHGRRLVSWTHDAPGQPDSLVAVGPYTREERRIGRLTVVIWRLPHDGTATVASTRATDTVIAAAADGWSRFWTGFGPIPRGQLTLVETDAPATRGATRIVFLGRDLTTPVLLRELARTWWGGYIRAEPSSPRFVAEWMPQWSAWSVAGVPPDASGPARDAFDLLRASLDAARLRDLWRTFAAAGRGGASTELFLSLLDPQTSTALRPALPEATR